ncbi:flagellar filament capping protein FliD [Kineococcus sp. SYSU DK001]|uniref:flagellar filament capping protein FliD n=1 Tax=Kineococcus sp. SYSU DK001 TaxID=3383122 RepID=UPI003D7C8229
MSSVSSAVDGLVSGLDTASIISSLMSVEAAPQTRLKSNVSTLQAKVTAYQAVNTKMSALQTAAKNLTEASTWTAAKATSSADGLTATASTSALPGSMSVYVDQLAQSRSVITTTPVKATDTFVGPPAIPFDVYDADGNFKGQVTQTGTLEQVAAAINKASAKLGITAVAVRVKDDYYRMQITSAKSGAAGDFKLVDAGAGANATEVGGITTLASAQNAKLYVTADGKTTKPSGSDPVIEVESSSNTFSDLMKGVTATVTKTGAATVAVSSDSAAVATAVKGLVDAANAALTEISKQSKSGVAGTDGTVSGAGALSGDSTLRALKAQILATITTPLGGSTSAAKYGIQSTRDGAITFNQDKFLAAYKDDPAAVQMAIAPTSVDSTKAASLAENLINVAKTATAARTGTLTTVIAGENNTISSLQDKIADWDTRLQARKQRYQTYYSNLEVALGKLQNQSTWLSGQLSQL